MAELLDPDRGLGLALSCRYKLLDKVQSQCSLSINSSSYQISHRVSRAVMANTRLNSQFAVCFYWAEHVRKGSAQNGLPVFGDGNFALSNMSFERN